MELISVNRPLLSYYVNKKNNKMELGPIQEKWVRGLETADPSIQCSNVLGTVDNNHNIISACCLGLLQWQNKKQFDSNLNIVDVGLHYNDQFTCFNKVLENSHKDYGLNSSDGLYINNRHVIAGYSYSTLAEANDEGVTWKDIAAYIRANPDNVFTHSV